MKKITLLLIFAFMEVLTISASTADDKVYIRKFYTEYKSAYEHDKDSYPPEKCYEIIKKYCTAGILKDMQDDPIGYDFPTDDYGMDALSLETLEIVSLSSGYLVSYNVNYETPLGEKKIQEVKLKVTMLNGKINNIEKYTALLE